MSLYGILGSRGVTRPFGSSAHLLAARNQSGLQTLLTLDAKLFLHSWIYSNPA